MTTIRIALGAILFIGLMNSAPASAQSDGDAERIFRKCSHELRHIVARCQAAHVSTVEHCVPRIRELLAAGHREEARALARRCIERIEATAENCISHTREICERCIRALRHLEANELARRMANRCEAAIKEIRSDCRRAARAIHRAFETDGGDGGGGGGDEA